jgi:predicted enzyme related to lactoylglutathione lyase
MKLANVTFDSTEPAKLAEFWSAALDLPIGESSEFFAMLQPTDGAGPRYLFLKVSEARQTKNRMHVDFHADDMAAEVERLVRLGAVRGDYHQEWGIRWTVMQDPEGNEFCVAAD